MRPLPKSLSASNILLLALGALFLFTAVRMSPLANLFEPASAQPVDEVVLDRSFTVRAGEHLRVDVGHADVVIEKAMGNEARVRITLEGRSMERARRFYEHLNFNVDHSGGVLAVTSDPQRSWNGSSGGADIEIVVSVPEAFNADLDVSHGDVQLTALKGEVALRLAHGDLDAGSIGGATLAMDVAHGDVDADILMSDRIRVSIQHGDLDVGSLAASELEIDAAHGDIHVREMDGFPRIASQHGDISLTMRSMLGGEFRTRHGDVDLTLPTDAGADIDFEASDVDVTSALRFEGTQRDGTFRGRINGGGPKLGVRAQHGSVSLRSL